MGGRARYGLALAAGAWALGWRWAPGLARPSGCDCILSVPPSAAARSVTIGKWIGNRIGNIGNGIGKRALRAVHRNRGFPVQSYPRSLRRA
jgi:hypothetical protein